MSLKHKIFLSQAGLEIVTDPYLVGSDLLEKSTECSLDFFKQLDISNLAQPITVLDILRGGRYYAMIEAFKRLDYSNKLKPKPKLQLAEIRASRFCDPITKEWKCRIWHDDRISKVSKETSVKRLKECNTLIIGDTIGTGTTLRYVLEWVLQLRTRNPLNVIVFTIAGSKNHILRDFVSKHIPTFNIYFANAAWFLNPKNGTDLGFITDEIHPNALKYIEHKCGKHFIKHMKCAVWDWGDRFNDIQSHLSEATHYFKQFPLDMLPKHIRKHVQKSDSLPSRTILKSSL